MSFLRANLIRSPAVVAAVLLLVGCGGEDGGMTTPTGEEIGSVVVMPDSTNVDIGSTTQLQPVVTSTTGDLVSEPVTWLSLDELVAEVDGSGLVTGARVGSTEVTATAGGVTGAAQIVVPVPLSGTAWFTNNAGEFISVLEEGSTSPRSIELGARASTIAFSLDGTTAWIGGDDQQVHVLDVASESVVGTIPLGKEDVQVALSPDGGRLYVRHYWSDEVSVIDPDSREVVATIEVREPTDAAFSPDGVRAYVTSGATNSVSVIDVVVGAIEATFSLDDMFETGGATAVAVSPDGSNIIVGMTNLNAPAFVDAAVIIPTETMVPSTFVPTRDFPGEIEFADDSLAWVLNGGSNDITVVDVRNEVVTATIPLSGLFPVAIEFSADGRLAYVVNQNSSQLSVIDVAARREIAVIELGMAPSSVALLPGG